MKQVFRYTGYILLVVITGFLIWKFYFIIIWILIAAVLSFIGEPFVRFFDSLHYRRSRFPHALSTLFSLLIIVFFFLGLISIFVPLILQQADTISKIDFTRLGENIQGPVHWLDAKLHMLGTIRKDQTIQDYIMKYLSRIVDLNNIGKLIAQIISAAGNMLLGFFAILFISFFFLEDEKMFENDLLLFVPAKNHDKTRRVIADSKRLLIRYFLGISIELTIIISLITFGLWILGIKNALLIGFFGGVMNIIPYLGPVIGTILGLTLGTIGALSTGSFDNIIPQMIKVLCVFLVVNFTDGHVLQPLIYSRSIKSHPLEVFLVIIIGGGLAGLPGMLLAVPAYTVLRVIAREFLQEFPVVRKLTETIDDSNEELPVP